MKDGDCDLQHWPVDVVLEEEEDDDLGGDVVNDLDEDKLVEWEQTDDSVFDRVIREDGDVSVVVEDNVEEDERSFLINDLISSSSISFRRISLDLLRVTIFVAK